MKTEFKGTKGEWYVDKNAMTVTTKGLVDGDIVCDAPEGFIESMENWKANAKLIAAAPDLLEALEETDKDLCVLFGQVKYLEQNNPIAEGLSNLVQKWRDRNKEAINKALN